MIHLQTSKFTPKMDDHNPPPSAPSSCSTCENSRQKPSKPPAFHEFFSHDFKGFPSSTEPYDDEYAVQIENYKAFIFKSVLLSSQTKSLSPTLRSLIEKRIDELFPDFQTPDHPPYAAMIEDAITTLNENGGSTAEAISQFIQNKYTDLPWAHDVFLKYHLERLCEERVVAKAGDRFHMLLSDVVTGQSPESCSMLDQAVVNHVLDLIPISDVSSWDTGATIKSSSSSFDSFPIPKRKCGYSLRQNSARKNGRKRSRIAQGTRIYLDSAAKICGEVGKEVVVGKETKLNALMQVLDGEIKEQDKQTDGKNRRTRGSKSKSTTSEKISKEVELNAEILLLEGEVKESEQQTVQKSVKKWRRKSKRNTEETAIHLDYPVRKKSRVCKKATEGKKAQVNSDILMLEGEAKESEKEGKHVVVECHDPVTGTKRTVIDINLDEHQDMVNEEATDLLERSIQKDNNGADEEQRESETFTNGKLGPFETRTIEVSQVQKNPKGQQNAEEEQEVDEAEMQNENQLEVEPVAAVKILPVGHDPEKSIYNEAGFLPTESFTSAFEEENDNLSKKNMEWQSDCFLAQPSEQLEEIEEMSEKILKLKMNSPAAEEGNEDTGSKLKQENPQVLCSSPCSSKLESQELSPQPQVLQPSQQEAEERPQRQQFWNWIRNSLRFH